METTFELPFYLPIIHKMKKFIALILMTFAQVAFTAIKSQACKMKDTKQQELQKASVEPGDPSFVLFVQMKLVSVEPEARLEYPRVANETCKGSDFRTVLVKPPTLSKHHLFSWSLSRLC